MRKEKTRGKGSHLFVGSLAGFHPRVLFLQRLSSMLYTHALKATEEKKFLQSILITHQDKLGFNRSKSVGCSNVTSRIGQPKGPD